MPDEIKLTPELEEKIRDAYNKNPDINIIVKQVFNNETLDGRSLQGRLVRSFLANAGLKYKTTKDYDKKTAEISFTDEQKRFILQEAENGNTAFEIAKLIFPQVNITSMLSKECRCVLEFLRQNSPTHISDEESGIGIDFSSPTTIIDAVKRINEACGETISAIKLTAQQRMNLTAFMRFMQNPRLKQLIDAYTDNSDKKLFEQQFISFTWNKPDLTADEVTLYIAVCQDIVHNKNLVKSRDKLNRMLNKVSEDDDGKELSIRLAENIKAISSDYDAVQKRIESVIKKLNGDRARRIEMAGDRTANFLALVEAFQQEDERKRLLMIAKAQKEKVKNEADRLESLDEYMGRILGVDKSDVI